MVVVWVSLAASLVLVAAFSVAGFMGEPEIAEPLGPLAVASHALWWCLTARHVAARADRDVRAMSPQSPRRRTRTSRTAGRRLSP